MVEKLYLSDSYLKEFDATVTSISGNNVELDRTAMYPTGGGQPCDTGVIKAGEKTYEVIEVKNSDNGIIHVLGRQPEFSVGTKVHCSINWQRRYAHMRYHTAVHIIGGIITKKYGGMYTGGQIYEDRARDDYDMPSLNRETAAKIIEEAQAVADEGHRVLVKMLSKEEAMKIESIARTAPGEELLKTLSTVRVIEIEGFDAQMDGGTHVSNTKEVGKMVLTGFENKGSHRKRIEIKLEP